MGVAHEGGFEVVVTALFDEFGGVLLVAVIGSGLFSLLYLIKDGKIVGFMVPKILPWDKEEFKKYKEQNPARGK